MAIKKILPIEEIVSSRLEGETLKSLSERFGVSLSTIKNRLYELGIRPGIKGFEDVCSVDGCEGAEDSRGYCHAHYCRLIRTGNLNEGSPINKYGVEGCSVDECPNSHFGLGYCSRHYRHTPASVNSRVKRQIILKSALVDDIDKDSLFQMWEHICFYCKDTLPEDARDRTIEHINPLSRGGLHSWENVVPSCRECNNRKRAKTFTEFVYSEGGFSFYDKR